jgi:hypothetical protein
LHQIVDPELLIEITDPSQGVVIETHGLGDRAPPVLPHGHRGVDLHLATGGEQQREHHRSCEQE